MFIRHSNNNSLLLKWFRYNGFITYLTTMIRSWLIVMFIHGLYNIYRKRKSRQAYLHRFYLIVFQFKNLFVFLDNEHTTIILFTGV